jgi:hypothetical protein
MITIVAGLAAMTPLLSTSGISARIVAAAVIRTGRTRARPPWITTVRTSPPAKRVTASSGERIIGAWRDGA